MFADIQQFHTMMLEGGGLRMGVSTIKDCPAKYLRIEGDIKVCADGNATDNWNTPPAGGWGFYDTGFADRVPCPADGFCPRKQTGDTTGYF